MIKSWTVLIEKVEHYFPLLLYTVLIVIVLLKFLKPLKNMCMLILPFQQKNNYVCTYIIIVERSVPIMLQ